MSDNLNEDEEFEHFDDFTHASSWERFISEIEAVCRQWLDDGPENLLVKDAVQMEFNMGLYKVKSEFRYAMKNYCMEFYFETNNDGEVSDWNEALHDLQLSFGVKEFLVVAPQSRSGVVLNAPEASKLLSAVAIALSNCSCLWPALVPVHDSSRKAYMGIQNMGTVFTRRFEADCIGGQVPIKLLHLEGLYELFVSKFTYAAIDVSMHHFKVHIKMKLTYRSPTYDDEDDLQDDVENFESNVSGKVHWDDDCPWSEWYTAEDPVKEFRLVAIWPGITAESSLAMEKLENASPLEADKWFLYLYISQNLGITDGDTVGFASQLNLLVDALKMSLEAQFVEDFVSDLNSAAVIPPPIVLDRVLKDLFHEVHESQLNPSLLEHKSPRSIKGAPLDSLFSQCCLHDLWFGNCNIRAIAVLWIEFVREVRWCWEESQLLPRMPTTGTIDLSTCLINQKLHMLAMCIYKNFQSKGYNISGHEDSASTHEQENPQSSGEHSTCDGVDGSGSSNYRKETYGVATSMMLLRSCKTMYAPITQDPPPMTEDMHEERLQAAQALGNSYMFSGQLEKDILASDMSAFKAANPDAVFEDFIRWHSPKDWENDSSDEIGSSHLRDSLEVEWPPRGRLSERMLDHGNSWRKIWNEALPLPASQQKPLFDPIREGEKALHYLETLRPQQLLEQIVCTAFSAATDTLNQTSFGGFKQMLTNMEQLYNTIASFLKYVPSYIATHDPDAIANLQQLCATFEHIEKLVVLAASLNRKFLQAPHHAEAIFNDYYDFYLPKMKSGDKPDHAEKEFEKKLEIPSQDRKIIADMFAPETAGNEDVRRGNLLGGHEPVSREFIFSKHDQASGSYYVSGTPTCYQQEIETHRMYVCLTSNDLRVALSVTSCD